MKQTRRDQHKKGGAAVTDRERIRLTSMVACAG